jgi:hypothetical protein
MKQRSLTAEDVLNDIEFEIVQGTISQSELGESIVAVKKYQNRLRNEVLESSPEIGDREILGRMFQLNDMLITVLQEVDSELRSLRLGTRRVAKLVRSTSATTGSQDLEAVDSEENEDIPQIDDLLDGLDLDFYKQTEDVMRATALQAEIDVQPSGVPIIGSIINRLKTALHELVVFYTGRLADRQSEINRASGDLILRLAELCESQQRQIDALNSKLETVQHRLSEME